MHLLALSLILVRKTHALERTEKEAH